MVGDCMGSVMAFDVLCSLHSDLTLQAGWGLFDKKKYASDTNLAENGDSRDNMDFSGVFLLLGSLSII